MIPTVLTLDQSFMKHLGVAVTSVFRLPLPISAFPLSSVLWSTKGFLIQTWIPGVASPDQSFMKHLGVAVTSVFPLPPSDLRLPPFPYLILIKTLSCSLMTFSTSCSFSLASVNSGL